MSPSFHFCTPPHCPPTIFRWRACFLHSESGCLSPPATRLQIKSNEGESSMMGHGSSFHHPHVSPQKSNFLLLTPGNYSSSLILFHVSFFFVDGLHSLFFLLIYFNKKHFFFLALTTSLLLAIQFLMQLLNVITWDSFFYPYPLTSEANGDHVYIYKYFGDDFLFPCVRITFIPSVRVYFCYNYFFSCYL